MTPKLRHLAVGAALVATLGTSIAVTAADPERPSTASRPPHGNRNEIELQILSFNDYHGHLQPPGGADATLGAQLDPTNTPVGGAEYLATTLDELREDNRNSLTVTAGDLIGGTPFLSGLFHDEPSVESLEAMGLDVSGVGNHEFDEGLAELVRMQYGGCHPVDGCFIEGESYDGADFPWLAANVVHAHSGKTVLPGTEVRTIQGVKVGFIGMTLENTPELVAQRGIEGLDFLDEVETANASAQVLRRQGVKTIIVLLHEGGIQAGTFGECEGISGPIVSIAENLSAEIDLVVTGHTHQPYICNVPDPRGAPRFVTSASSFGRVVSETTLVINKRSGEVKRSKVTSANHLVTRTVAPDPTQTAIIEKWSAISAPIANRVVGTITEDIVASPNRDTEGPLANLIADAQLLATAPDSLGGAQIALMNPGGVRANLTFSQISGGEQPGEVTYGEAFTVQPFGNLLVTMDLTGEQIERLLEQQAIATRSRPVLIFGISDGFTFTYDGTRPFGDRIDPASIMLDGAVLDAAATYRVTTNNFLADGGDGFTVFTEGTNRAGGGDDLVALTDYLGAFSPVSPPADRIAGI
jgi:2',3'-cyclic-nucleotide 2'-phosphodiesterase (5'-nucleotidase family)